MFGLDGFMSTPLPSMARLCGKPSAVTLKVIGAPARIVAGAPWIAKFISCTANVCAVCAYAEMAAPVSSEPESKNAEIALDEPDQTRMNNVLLTGSVKQIRHAAKLSPRRRALSQPTRAAHAPDLPGSPAFLAVPASSFPKRCRPSGTQDG